jgi:hypothetical protein
MNRDEYLPYAPGPSAPGPRPWADIQADLERDVWPGLFGTKDRKNNATNTITTIPFLGWPTVKQILDRYVPGWSYIPVSHQSLDGMRVIVDVILRIPTSDYGIVERGATGSDTASEKSYGETADRAESKALRRAAAKFGIGFRLYHDKRARQEIVRWLADQGRGSTQPDDESRTQDGGADGRIFVAGSPRPHSSGVSDRQLGAIYAIGRNERHLSEAETDAACLGKFGRPPQELTGRQASDFIDLLKSGNALPQPPSDRPPAQASAPVESRAGAGAQGRSPASTNGAASLTRAAEASTHETPVPRITEEQFNTLKRLESALGWGPEDKVQYLHPYHATVWKHLTFAEAAACIADLTPQAALVQAAP